LYDNDKDNLTRKDVMKFLINLIKERKFKASQKLYSENFIAHKLGINRSMVHEVYTALECMGILECIHGKGTYLKQVDNSVLNSPLCILAFLLEGDPLQTLDFRRIIEIGIVEKVIQQITTEDINKMYEAIENIKNTDDYMEASKNDILIHSIYVNSIDNELISFVYNMSVTYITYISNDNWKKILLSEKQKFKKAQIAQHFNIIKSLEERNVKKCKKYILEHITYIGDILMK